MAARVRKLLNKHRPAVVALVVALAARYGLDLPAGVAGEIVTVLFTVAAAGAGVAAEHLGKHAPWAAETVDRLIDAYEREADADHMEDA